MYSEKENTENKYEIFKILVNDNTVIDYTAGYTDNNRFFLSSPLSYFNKFRLNNFVDPTLPFFELKLGKSYAAIQPLLQKIHNGSKEQQQFPGWYKRYLEQTVGITIHKLQVDILITHFDANQQLQTDSSYSLLTWEQR